MWKCKSSGNLMNMEISENGNEQKFKLSRLILSARVKRIFKFLSNSGA
jgi:hypothetical protein